MFKSWIASLNLAQRNDWDARKPKVLKFMKEQLRCSAYLLQETDLEMAVYLAVGLGWSTHEGSPCWGGDKNRNFVIFDDNKFWHRETYAPSLSKKKYDLAYRHHRSAVWVSLIHMASGEKITLGSSHLSNGSDTGPDRKLQAERLVETLPTGPLALGIDRNSRGTSSPAKILNSAGLKDATFGLDPRRTYKSGDPRRDGVQIDAIHVRDAYLENVTLLETVGLTDHRAWRAKLVVPTPV